MDFLPSGAAELAKTGPEQHDSHGGGASYIIDFENEKVYICTNEPNIKYLVGAVDDLVFTQDA